MQLPAPFEYERATSIDEAIALLERHGPDARVIAGGHSLLPMMKLRLARPDVTGRIVTAEEGLAWGLVSRVVPHDSLMDEATAVLEMCCRTAPQARFDVKRTIHEYYGMYDRMAMDASYSGGEMLEGYHAFKERRSPNWVPEDLRIDGRL